MQIKTTMRYHNTTVRMAITKTKNKQTKKPQEITSAGQDVEKREPLCTVGRNVNWCSHYGKQYEDFSKHYK